MRDEFCTALGNPQPGRPPLAPDYLPSVSSQWSTPVRDGLSSVRVSQHALMVALTSPGRLLVDRSSPVSGPPVSSEHVPLVLQDGSYPGPLGARAAALDYLRRLPHTAHVLRVPAGVRFCAHHRPSGCRQVGEASRKVSWTFFIHLLSLWRAQAYSTVNTSAYRSASRYLKEQRQLFVCGLTETTYSRGIGYI